MRRALRSGGAGVVLGALALLPLALLVPAWADDVAARRDLAAARARWRDPDPGPAQAALEAALREARSPELRLQVLHTLGRFHQARTGELELALACYAEVASASAGPRQVALRALQAEALLDRAGIVFAERGDVAAALAAAEAGHALRKTPRGAELLSQLLLRAGHDPARDARARAEALAAAQARAHEALLLDAVEAALVPEADLARARAATARYRLQLALVLATRGRRAEAEGLWRETARADLDVQSAYVQAQLRARLAAPPAEVAALLAGALAPEVRPTARARNQLRRFARSEPELAPYVGTPPLAELLREEPEPSRARR